MPFAAVHTILVSVVVDFEIIEQRDPETGKAFLFAMKLQGGEAFLVWLAGKLAFQRHDGSQPRNCRCQPLPGVQPAVQPIISHGFRNLAPPVRQRREGRDPNGRRPFAGSVSKANSTGRRRRLARIIRRTHHRHESIETDRFKYVVGRRVGVVRFFRP